MWTAFPGANFIMCCNRQLICDLGAFGRGTLQLLLLMLAVVVSRLPQFEIQTGPTPATQHMGHGRHQHPQVAQTPLTSTGGDSGLGLGSGYFRSNPSAPETSMGSQVSWNSSVSAHAPMQQVPADRGTDYNCKFGGEALKPSTGVRSRYVLVRARIGSLWLSGIIASSNDDAPKVYGLLRCSPSAREIVISCGRF